MDRRSWIERNLDANSQLWNVRYFNGDPNECISGRCYRENRAFWVDIIDAIFWIFAGQDNHCKNAYLKDNMWAGKRLEKIK